jgi:hypothetical protein
MHTSPYLPPEEARWRHVDHDRLHLAAIRDAQ